MANDKKPKIVKPKPPSAKLPTCTFSSGYYGQCHAPVVKENRLGFCRKHIELADFLIIMYPIVVNLWQEQVKRAQAKQPNAPHLWTPGSPGS